MFWALEINEPKKCRPRPMLTCTRALSCERKAMISIVVFQRLTHSTTNDFDSPTRKFFFLFFPRLRTCVALNICNCSVNKNNRNHCCYFFDIHVYAVTSPCILRCLLMLCVVGVISKIRRLLIKNNNNNDARRQKEGKKKPNVLNCCSTRGTTHFESWSARDKSRWYEQ